MEIYDLRAELAEKTRALDAANEKVRVLREAGQGFMSSVNEELQVFSANRLGRAFEVMKEVLAATAPASSEEQKP